MSCTEKCILCLQPYNSDQFIKRALQHEEIFKTFSKFPTPLPHGNLCDNCYSKFEHYKNTHQEKASNIISVKYIDYKDITPELIKEYLFIKKEPLVITNALEALKSGTNIQQEYTSGNKKYSLFSLDFLRNHFGDTQVSPRNNETFEDLKGWNMRKFVDYLETPIYKRAFKRLYGKDLYCPVQWKDFLFKNKLIPDLFIHRGKRDCFAHLPPGMLEETVMFYMGSDGTFTPGHKDLCATIGHNIMVYADKCAYSEWHLFRSTDVDEVDKFWIKHTKSSLDEDNRLLPLKLLKTAPFPMWVIKQKVGDFVLIPPNAPHQVINRVNFFIKKIDLQCRMELQSKLHGILYSLNVFHFHMKL